MVELRPFLAVSKEMLGGGYKAAMCFWLLVRGSLLFGYILMCF